jgi:HK97 family phage portal protein
MPYRFFPFLEVPMKLMQRISRWWRRKSVDDDDSFIDLTPRRSRQPSGLDLLDELKSTAWACASLNASVCASLPPRLFVTLGPELPRPRCLTRALDTDTAARLKAARGPHQGHTRVEEIVEHPVLTLLHNVNALHNAFDLLEMTQLSLEVHGAAYWLLDLDPLAQQPRAIWILPSHLVAPVREPNSARLIDAFEFRGQRTQRYAPERIIHFRYPDPRDPYSGGLSPLKACFDQAALMSEFATFKRTVYDNAAVPSVLITPDDGFGPEERKRLETQWRQKLQRGGQGGALVADGSLKVKVLSHSMGDLAALADMKASKEDIANAFHVPLPFLTGDTNLANMQAADHMHKSLAILPRLRRRDEKLNEQLIPHIDPTGRLFFATPDPTPANQSFLLEQEQADLRLGVRTVNEVRASRGLPPVPWGDAPREQSV